MGVIMAGNQFAVVSEWMANGNIKEFIVAHPNANRFQLVSSIRILSLIIDDGEYDSNSSQMSRRA